MTPAANPPLLEVRDLHKSFPRRRSLRRLLAGLPAERVHALNGINLLVERGETLAIVGESGCGKSTLARCLVRLHEADRGSIRYAGIDVRALKGGGLSAYNRRMQMVFQDPYGSLNPRKTVAGQISEPIRVHNIRPRAEIAARVKELLNLVRLPVEVAGRYPHAFSGGQRQRVGIARALALEPECLIADEIVSALDVSIQAQIINLLLELQQQLHLTIVFVSHDLRMVRHVAHRVAVMYLGRVVELGPTERVFGNPLHPYTQALIAAAPSLDFEHRNDTEAVAGEPPSSLSMHAGCAFQPRCKYAIELCRRQVPPEIVTPDGQMAACHLVGR
ncbi:MAG TPA: oligopeptide/dipeptide ABC transporter ATP-binding protein [Acetobacteraceae bacterium]